MENNDEKWFEKYEQQLKELLEAKADIDSRLDNLRKQILVQMIDHKEEKLKTDNFSVTLAPPRYFVQFDSKRFKEEHEDLFAQYCKAERGNHYHQKTPHKVHRRGRRGNHLTSCLNCKKLPLSKTPKRASPKHRDEDDKGENKKNPQFSFLFSRIILPLQPI